MDPLANLEVATPCSMIWEQMKGNERVRRCARCRCNVYDPSAMTSAEATQLFAQRGGHLFRRADGRVLMEDCRGGRSSTRVRRFLLPIFVAFSAMFIVGVLTGSASVRRIPASPAVAAPERPPPNVNGVLKNGKGCGFPRENDRY